MEQLANQIQGLNTLFIQLEGELDYLLENRDDLRKERFEFLVNTIEKKREELKSKYESSILKQFNPIFDAHIKSVSEKLSKIIEYKREDLDNIKKLLKISGNRKKVAQYQK